MQTLHRAMLMGTAGLVVLLVGGSARTAPQTQHNALSRDAAMEQIVLTQSVAGHPRWRLEAGEVLVQESQNRMLFYDLHLTVYLQEGGEMVLSGPVGTFDTTTHDVTIDGEGQVLELYFSSGYRIHVPTVTVIARTEELRSSGPVTITAPGFTVHGRRLLARLAAQEYEVSQDVHAEFYD